MPLNLVYAALVWLDLDFVKARSCISEWKPQDP